MRVPFERTVAQGHQFPVDRAFPSTVKPTLDSLQMLAWTFDEFVPEVPIAKFRRIPEVPTLPTPKIVALPRSIETARP